MGNWADDLLLECMVDPYFDIIFNYPIEEVACQKFYESVFYKSDFYMRYMGRMQLPVTYSNYDGDGAGTWRSIAFDDIQIAVEGRNDAYISACTYFPKKNKMGTYKSTNSQTTASQLCAFVLDFDDVSTQIFKDCLYTFWPEGLITKPTYVVTTGNGVHFWYVLDEPVEMLKRWRLELDRIAGWLGEQYDEAAWSEQTLAEYRTSDGDWEYENLEISYRLGKHDRHGLTQSYRVVGSLSKDGKHEVTAWRIGDTWDIDFLADKAGLKQQFKEEVFDMSASLQSAEWAAQKALRQTAIERTGGKKGKGWNPGVYQWLASEILDRTKYYNMYHHRYYQILCLGICARKDNISYQEAWAVAKDACKGWNKCSEKWGHPGITFSECEKALKSAYKWDPAKVKRVQGSWMAELCGWKWESHQKRNGRTQEQHIIRMNRNRKGYIEDGDDSAKGGRKPGSKDTKPRAPHPVPKKKLIQDYATAHPDATQREIAAALKVSKTTVNKWLREPER